MNRMVLASGLSPPRHRRPPRVPGVPLLSMSFRSSLDPSDSVLGGLLATILAPEAGWEAIEILRPADHGDGLALFFQDRIESAGTRSDRGSGARIYDADAREQPRAFPAAAERLYRALRAAAGEFGEALGSFEEETSGVRAYADGKLLEALWACKVKKMVEAEEVFIEGINADKELVMMRRVAGKKPYVGPRLRAVSEELIMAMEGVLASEAVPTAGQSSMETTDAMERMKRAIKKVRDQFQDIIGLVKESCRSSSVMRSLVKEVSLMIKVLEDNADLWDLPKGEGRAVVYDGRWYDAYESDSGYKGWPF